MAVSRAAVAVVSIAANAAVSDVAVGLSNDKTLESSSYAVSFTTGAALAGGDTITLRAPTGTDFFDSTGWSVVADGAPVFLARSAGRPDANDFTNNEAVVTIGSPIAAASRVTVTSSWVTNPGPGKRYRLAVETSAEPTAVDSAPYEISGVGRVVWRTFTPAEAPTRCWGSAFGTTNCAPRAYMVYKPPGFRQAPRRSLPLLVDLQGCFTTAATEARWSRFHLAAADRGFVVLFPQQSPAANGGRCWNWFDPEHQHRENNEPAIIAGIVGEVIQRFKIDPDRVYVSGISAGGAMSNIMMVTYPDLFAAGVVNAGCQYGGLPCLGAASAQPTIVAATAAATEMSKSRLRSVPVFVVAGSLDELVPVPNSEQVVQQWLAIDDIRRTGSPNPVPRLPSESSLETPPGKEPYTLDIWRDAEGCVLAQRWIVHGMTHQWSGAESNGSPIDTSVADPDGPDLTRAIVDFFLDRSMPEGDGPCDVADAP